MAKVIITFKIMPENVKVDLSNIEKKVKEKIISFGGEFGKSEVEEIAFGLKALKIMFILEEGKGSTDELEDDIKEVDGVRNVEVVDVRRAIG